MRTTGIAGSMTTCLLGRLKMVARGGAQAPGSNFARRQPVGAGRAAWSNERDLLTGRHHVPWRNGVVAGNGHHCLKGATVSRSLTGPARRHAEEEAGPAPLLLLLHRSYDVHESQCRPCNPARKPAASTAASPEGGVKFALRQSANRPHQTWDENDVSASQPGVAQRGRAAQRAETINIAPMALRRQRRAAPCTRTRSD